MKADQFKFGSLYGKFLCALFLAGAVGFCGYVVQKSVVDSAEIYAQLADISSRQRMLSQRAALLLLSAQNSAAHPDRDFSSQLEMTLDELESNHAFLLAQQQESPGSWSPALDALYFGDARGIDASLRQYTAGLRSFLEQPLGSRPTTEFLSPADPRPADPNPAVMLGMLDQAVRHYIGMLNDRIEIAGQLSLLIFAVDALALLLLALFVFRPMLSRLRGEHKNLKETYRRLLDEMSERCQLDRQRAAAELKFRNAFENAPIGIGLVKPNGELFDANPSLRRMFYRGNEEAQIDFSTVFDEPDRARFFDLVQESIQHNEVRTRQLRCLDCHDDEMHTMVSLSPVREDRRDIDYLVLQVQDITESHSLNTKLKRQASYDELTGLLNRRAFNNELEEAWSASETGRKESYLLMMDLDQFKVINDTSGHAAGDQLLRRVSAIIKECVRSDDRVCRLGGDEFGVLLPHCPAENASRIAETIRTSIHSLRFVWGQQTYRVGVSIGVVEIDPSLGDISEIQQLADAACYAAKESGRNCVQMVTEGKNEVRLHRREIRWVQRLREAMEKRRFVIYGQVIKPAQPDSSLEERTEILLRLRDPDEKRLIPPGAFLPAAERYGLNVELDEWVVTSLIDLLYIQQSFGAPLGKYWVNLSGNSVGDERFAKQLLQLMKHSPLAVGTINFEITETAVIRNLSSAGRFINELRDMGCQIALDDFGSGLSSFGYLKHLPIDYLKIDGMFIKDIHRDPMNRIFVKSIIDIAHTLDIKTVAEYIEDQATASIVTELGVDYLQGYLFGEPRILAPEFGKPVHARLI